MRYTLAALMLALCTTQTMAQKHNAFTDVGLPGGFSATYSYKLSQRIGVGIGFQGYSFSPTIVPTRQFTPAVYADLRLYQRIEKTNQFFSFLDLGANFYNPPGNPFYQKGNMAYKVDNNKGIYLGLGFGYMRKMTQRGGGPYASLKIIMNCYKTEGYNIATQHEAVYGMANGTFAFSVGFKF